MSKELILAILGSTVISSIITTIFNYLQKNKDNKINNISSERTKWRNEIRKIAEKLSSNTLTIEEFDEVLVRLKVRVNPLEHASAQEISVSHSFVKNKWVIKNGYLSEVMDEIQQKRLHCDEIEEFANLKMLLIDRISILLKLDWERSKREIAGEIKDKIFIFFMFIFVTCMIVLIYTNTFYLYTTHVTLTNLLLVLGLMFPFILRLFIYINLIDFGKLYLAYTILNIMTFIFCWVYFFDSKGSAAINLLFIIAIASNAIVSTVNLSSKYQEDQLYKDVLDVILENVELDRDIIDEDDIMMNKKLRVILEFIGGEALTSELSNKFLEMNYVNYVESKFQNRFRLLSGLMVLFFVSLLLGGYFLIVGNYLLLLVTVAISMIIFITVIFSNRKKNKDMFVIDNLLKLHFANNLLLEESFNNSSNGIDENNSTDYEAE